jgi:hypothetical protein
VGFQELVKEMVNHDLQVAEQEAMLQKATGRTFGEWLPDKSVSA